MEDPNSNEKLQSLHESSKGGIRTMPFIIANETFEKVASFGLLANMILYLIQDYHMSNATGTSTIFIWSAATNFLPILGAFIADSYLGRFRVIALGSVTSLLGVVLLWLTAMVSGAKPDTCYSQQNCKPATAPQMALLLLAFALMSIGAGGIRPCSLAFGADQFYENDSPKNARIIQSFFNWYYASVAVSLMISITVIVYIQVEKGWKIGLGIPVILMALSTTLFMLGSPFYKKVKAHKSLFTELAQVVAASYKNRGLSYPPKTAGGQYHHSKGSNLVAPSDKMRFLNKACIIRNGHDELNPDGSASNPWDLCTVEQVEVFKSVIRVIPIWSAGIMNAVIISQHSFPVLQANTMDRHMGPKFQIPAGSFGIFGILSLTIWVAFYDRILVPIIAKFTNRRRGLSLKQRMGIGLLISCLATSTAALVERKRRMTAIQEGLSDNGKALVNISAMWLVPQQCLTGLAEAFNIIGQIEFYYTEFPKTMSSVAVALFSLGIGTGNLVGSLIVELVDKASSAGGRVSWVANNLNKGHYDYYYWVLTILSFINFLYFLWCSWSYGLTKDEIEEAKVLEKGEVMMVEENRQSFKEVSMVF